MEQRVNDYSKVDSMVVFDSPLKLPYVEKPVYGFVFDSSWYSDKNDEAECTHSYIEYLSALRRWCLLEGGEMSEDTRTWYMEGRAYTFRKKGFFKRYMEVSYALHPINYMIKQGCNPKFGTGDLEDNFIIRNIIREQWGRKH